MLALKADCNTVGGSYIVDGQSITIMLGPTTMAFCGEESLDQMYLAALSQAATFEIDEDALVIGLAGNAGSMAFATVAAEESAPEAAPAVPAAAAEPISPAGLQNVLWQWDRFTGATKADTYEVPNPEQYQLAFLADGVFAVHADCNRGRGVYLTGADGSMALDVTLLTRAMCGPMSLEGRFLELLDKVTAYVLTEGNLYMDLTTADGVMHLSAGGAAITGNVTYLDRKALPPDAIVKVTLNDISRADAPQVVLGEQVIAANGGQPPFPFAVSYDPSVIVENHTYGMRARIEDSTGKLLYTSDTVTPVITRGNPVSDVEIVVVPVQ
jgi:putative lipoprotein